MAGFRATGATSSRESGRQLRESTRDSEEGDDEKNARNHLNFVIGVSVRSKAFILYDSVAPKHFLL